MGQWDSTGMSYGSDADFGTADDNTLRKKLAVKKPAPGDSGLPTDPSAPEDPNSPAVPDSYSGNAPLNQPPPAVAAVPAANSAPTPSLPGPGPGAAPLAPASPDSGGVKQKVTQALDRVNEITSVPKPSPKEYRDALSVYDKVNENLKLGGVDTSSTDKALADAKEAYQSEKDRNQLLGLVQMVGQSFARLAAGAYGNSHGDRDIAGKLDLSNVDYDKRNELASQDYKTAVGLAENRDRNQRLDLSEKNKYAYDTARDKAGAKVGVEKDIYNEGVREYGDDLRHLRDLARESAGDAKSEAQQKKIYADSGRKQASVLGKAESELTKYNADLAGETAKGKPKIQDAESYVRNTLNQWAPESADKFEEELKAKKDDVGFFDNEQEVEAPVLKTYLQKAIAGLKKQQEIARIQSNGMSDTDAQAEYDKRHSAAPPPAATPPPAAPAPQAAPTPGTTPGAPSGGAPVSTSAVAPAPGGLVSVRGPSGTVAQMTPENAKKYLAQPGYTQVK